MPGAFLIDRSPFPPFGHETHFRAYAAVGHPAFMSPHASPLVVAGGFVFVANTAADTVDVSKVTSTGRNLLLTLRGNY
jgi:hypothetical protein